MLSWTIDIKNIIKALKPISDIKDADAAVALMLNSGMNQNLMVFFVKRVENYTDPWSGQIAFPGGKRSIKDENLKQTIIRETFEETMPDLEEALWREADKGRVRISDSWDDMAGWIGADPEELKDTIEQYNSFCEQGNDKEFAKNRQYLLALNRAPLYAIKGMAVLLDTIGGIRINEVMQVLDDRNEPIPGLYAAGVVTSGWESETYCSELSASAFGFAVNSGRIAGENAVGSMK